MGEKDFSKIKKKSNICINVFSYENELVFPIYVSSQKFENSMDLLLMCKSNYVYYINRIMCKSEILTDLCFTKQSKKTKSTFAKVVFSVLVVKMC